MPGPESAIEKTLMESLMDHGTYSFHLSEEADPFQKVV